MNYMLLRITKTTQGLVALSPDMGTTEPDELHLRLCFTCMKMHGFDDWSLRYPVVEKICCPVTITGASTSVWGQNLLVVAVDALKKRLWEATHTYLLFLFE